MSHNEIEPVTGVRLAIDVGQARVGVAATDPSGILASPVTTLKRDHKQLRDISKCLSIAEERNATRIYVGEPINLRGQDTASTTDARNYAEQLAKKLAQAGKSIDVVMIDERLSTASASRQMSMMGRSTRKQRSVIDQAAAVEILEHALDMEKLRGTVTGEKIYPSVTLEPDMNQEQEENQ